MSLVPRSDNPMPSCPAESKWYTCATESKFVGCCTTDPCNSVGCSAGNTFPATINPKDYGTIVDASCGIASGAFYQCTSLPETNGTFWGCCKNKKAACAFPDGCPKEDFVGAFLDTPTQINYYITNAKGHTQEKKKPVAAIAGGAAGGSVALIIIAFIIFFVLRKKRSKKNKHQNRHQNGTDDYVSPFSPTGEKPHESSYYDSPLPPYTSPAQKHAFPTATKYIHQAQGNHVYEMADGSTLSPTAGLSNRYSELPSTSPQLGSNSQVSEMPAETVPNPNRLSELPSEAPRFELESPRPSPMVPASGEWSTNPNHHHAGNVQLSPLSDNGEWSANSSHSNKN